MSKQTAVEWLIAQIKQTVSMSGKVYELERQAKQLEREQVENAFVAGDERGTKNIPFNAEQYYTQTYGKTK